MPTNQSNTNDIDVFESASNTTEKFSALAPGEIVLGTIVAIDALGQPMVDFPQNLADQALPAITTIALV